MSEIGGNELSAGNKQAASQEIPNPALPAGPHRLEESAGQLPPPQEQAGLQQTEPAREVPPTQKQTEAHGFEDARKVPPSFCQNGHQLEAQQLACLVCGLSERADAVQKKIREHKLKVDEILLSRALVLPSKRELEDEWLKKRAEFPDSEHDLLAALLERKFLSQEDLIILISADSSNFSSAEDVLVKSEKLAAQVFGKRGKKPAQLKNLKFDRDAAASSIKLSRSQIYEEMDLRIADFARCGIEVIDAWADNYRLEKYLPLDHCLVLLSVPKELWLQLPKQQYISEILRFGERRIMAGINQGPLVCLRIARNSSTLDLRELDTASLGAEKILAHLVSRSQGDVELSPELLKSTPGLERRIRNLVLKTSIFKRDTGKHSLFLGFPFIAFRSIASADTKIKLRVAPVLLFPVRIDAQIGKNGKIALACSDSDEIRLNPALAGVLGLSPKEEEKWKEALDQMLSSETIIKPDEIVKTFASFLGCDDMLLSDIPSKEMASSLEEPTLFYSSALFHCDFAGKAVADDLNNICAQSISGTALELALRLAPQNTQVQQDAQVPQDAQVHQTLPSTNEASTGLSKTQTFDLDDFAVIAADPSQETAVKQSRQSSGLHIEGPPGTGKSQTIVNIIADSVARNETVLVICQKQAALSVVEKRLKAEGLGSRLFYITDISKDRQPVLKSLREQLDARHAGQKRAAHFLRKERAGLCTRIQSLEDELNKYHEAVHRVDEQIGRSYRQVLAELIEIESLDPYVFRMPRLRISFRDSDNTAATALAEECASIANLWLESKYEISPLQDLKEFVADEAEAQFIMREFSRFVQAEEQRLKTLSDYPRSKDVDDISIYVSWLRENEDYIREIPRDVRLNLSKWVSHFFPGEAKSNSLGSSTMEQIEKIADELNQLSKKDHLPRVFPSLTKLSTSKLNSQIQIAISASSKGGFLKKINPIAALNRYRLKNLLKDLNLPANEKSALEFLRASVLEKKLRPHREMLEQICSSLSLEVPEHTLDLMQLQHFVSVLLKQLSPVAELAARLISCPLNTYAREFAERAEPAAFDDFDDLLKGVIRRHAAKTESLNRLSALSQWFDEEWLAAQKRVIASSKGNLEAARHIQRYLHTLVAFQEFRLRAKSMSPQALEILASLRVHESALSSPAHAAQALPVERLMHEKSFPASEDLNEDQNAQPSIFPPIPQSFLLGSFSADPADSRRTDSKKADLRETIFLEAESFDLVKRIVRVVRKEACLTWKSRLETQEPALMIPKEEIKYKVRNLAEADNTLRELNRKILSEPNPDASIAEGKKWEELTRLSGARARRLRELLSSGAGLGLMQLRPVWLMNPETASRLLPLTPGLFDLVIFDEASQLLVEYAYPALFRAKRAVVSGDAKQMPPPTFFSARLENDEVFNMDEDEIDDMLPQAERDRIEEAWNRREIKDCPDLLNLAAAVLPTRSLQIHYRSEFKELIAFSNAAFYSSTLSVPSKRPATAVRKSRPIEVVPVNSVYEKQVNRGEAEKIAEILQRLWSAPPEMRPTVGVLSFNLKQAQLIEEVLENRARASESFREAFEEESRRQEDGEDLAFFVKNLENVQGDERDIIIFSTTFGFDQAGKFRRNFGKLGQDGGERRLNVAVTRAKQKVILVTSLPCEKISDYMQRSGFPSIPRDYLQAYMDYAAKVSSGSLEAADKGLSRLLATDSALKRFESDALDPFVKDVAAFVRRLGYEAVTRRGHSSDAFEIDIAIENPKTGLFAIGIECDAPEHILLASAKHREIWRQSVLAKSIARVHRISSRDWYQRKEREKELLQAAIAEAMVCGES